MVAEVLNVTGTASKGWLEKSELPASTPCLIYHPRVWFSQISEKSTIPEIQEVFDLPLAFKIKTLISKSGKNETCQVMTCSRARPVFNFLQVLFLYD